jgi:glucose-1-phosphate thymidylyltransferase
MWAKEVEDPSAYGVLVLDENNYIKKMVEKPEEFISNLANVGIYYIKNYELLFREIEYIIKKDIKRKGEYYVTSAFQRMFEKGEKMIIGKVDKWLDCGNIDSLLETNQYLLSKKNKIEEKGKNCKIIKPVYIEKGAKLENSTIGPFVSIGKGTEIKDSFIENSIIGLENIISNVRINSSVIGSYTKVSGGEFKKLNIGNHSHIEIRFE